MTDTTITTATDALEAAIDTARLVQYRYRFNATSASAIGHVLESLYVLRSRVQEPKLDVEGLKSELWHLQAPTWLEMVNVIDAWAARQETQQGGAK